MSSKLQTYNQYDGLFTNSVVFSSSGKEEEEKDKGTRVTTESFNVPTALFTPRKQRPLVVPDAISESEDNPGEKTKTVEELLAIAVSIFFS